MYFAPSCGKLLIRAHLAAFLALIAVSPIVAQQSDQPQTIKNPYSGDAAAVQAGKVLYQQTCEACHGGEAEGGRGPALATGNFTHGGEDGDLFRTIRTGVPGTQMPAFSTLPTENVWRIITYLRSLNTNNAAANEVVQGNPAAGEAIFWDKGGCGRCHEVNERGATVGPDLSEVGKNSAEYLRTAIVNPNAPVSFRQRRQRPVALTVITQDGKTVEGVKVAEDNFTLIMNDLNGNLRRFDRKDIREEHVEQKSLMPANYEQVLSPDDLQDLVAYLKTLKTRDFSQTAKAALLAGLTFERLRNADAEPQNWLTYWGDYQGHHYSTLHQINTGNVKQLEARWALQMPPGPLLEATPLVVDGTMYTTYTTDGAAGVFAVDAKSGLTLWHYERRQKVVNPYQSNPFNRGVAVLGGRVFFGTLDAALVALDARTGRPVWETQVANTMQGYSITAAPLALKNEVIVGVAGGEFGIRGFIDAYDAVTGKRLWRFNTVPAPGEFGGETWSGDSWKRGSGATWLTGSYDPNLDQLYWTVGNPGPDMDASVRQGDNLFTSSVVALDPATGVRKWHYQFTPGDTHDWDANEDVVLTNHTVGGVQRELMLQANRNGIFYVLNRNDGKLVLGKPYVKQTWNGGFHPDGTPILLPNWKATEQGNVVAPTGTGGVDWANPSYDSVHAKLYVSAKEGSAGFRSAPQKYVEGRLYGGGRPFAPPPEETKSGLIEIDGVTGTSKWVYPTFATSMAAGVLATGGDLVFLATGDGDLIALDRNSWLALWHFQTGGTIASAPMSYSVDGQQFVAISAGNTLYSFALPD